MSADRRRLTKEVKRKLAEQDQLIQDLERQEWGNPEEIRPATEREKMLEMLDRQQETGWAYSDVDDIEGTIYDIDGKQVFVPDGFIVYKP